MNVLLAGVAGCTTLFAPAALATPVPAVQSVDETIVCRTIATDPMRTWTFTSQGGTWRVTHQVDGRPRRASLALPKATVALTTAEIDIRARTANGGIDLTLRGPWSRATLDAYISYELEVNVDASLTPDIDDIATEAPTGVACTRPAPQ